MSRDGICSPDWRCQPAVTGFAELHFELGVNWRCLEAIVAHSLSAPLRGPAYLCPNTLAQSRTVARPTLVDLFCDTGLNDDARDVLEHDI